MTENTKVTQDEVNQILWKACDTFRGILNSADYKNYILPMLFLKYISDTWEEKYEKIKQEYKGNEKRIQSRLKRERFVIPEGCLFKNLYDKREKSNIGEVINTALEKIEDANKEKLNGVFRNIDFNSEAKLGETKDRNARLKHLLEDFNHPKLNLKMSHIGKLDIIGNAYEFLISRFAASGGQKAGEFYTPGEVSDLIARLVEPQRGDRICDPACGSGSLLLKCANQLLKKGEKDFHLYGQEINGETFALAKMNMFLHGVDNSKLEWGDTIRNPKLIQSKTTIKFEVVVANPPFSLDKWGHEKASKDPFKRFHRGIPPKTKGDFAFISHMVETITENNGRVGVVVPHGVLFRGSSEAKIRQKLIEENLLDTVIGLPANLFFGTGIPAAILIFKKNKKDDSVFFVDASSEYQEGKNQNKLRERDIEKIVRAFKKRKNMDKYTYKASFKEIEENDFNLNIPRYVDTFEEEEEIDIKTVQKEIEGLKSELSKVRKQMDKYLKELGL